VARRSTVTDHLYSVSNGELCGLGKVPFDVADAAPGSEPPFPGITKDEVQVISAIR
jgi:hypothetical protein